MKTRASFIQVRVSDRPSARGTREPLFLSRGFFLLMLHMGYGETGPAWPDAGPSTAGRLGGQRAARSPTLCLQCCPKAGGPWPPR